MESKFIASTIDHTVLKPDLSTDQIIKIGEEVLKYNFASACIPPAFVPLLRNAFPSLKICTVVSFPFGYDTTKTKLAACESAVHSGIDEVDLVVNIAFAKAAKWEEIKTEMALINDYLHENDKLVKWIFENCYLNSQEIIKLCTLCNETNADFAKTSTGFGTYGARIEDVELMKAHLDPKVAIKASGGIRTRNAAIDFIEAGASRIGSSSGVKIIS